MRQVYGSREGGRNEFEADGFAATTLGEARPLVEALLRNWGEKNLSRLTPHPFYSSFEYSHPTLTERVVA